MKADYARLGVRALAVNKSVYEIVVCSLYNFKAKDSNVFISGSHTFFISKAVLEDTKTKLKE